MKKYQLVIIFEVGQNSLTYTAPITHETVDFTTTSIERATVRQAQEIAKLKGKYAESIEVLKITLSQQS